jgi:hypothetical protein
MSEPCLKIDPKNDNDLPADQEAIKIYVGTQIEQMLAVKVLHYSIQEHTQHPVSLIPLFQAVEAAGIHIPTPADPKLRPRTPFSFQRFAIPQLNGYQGRAIYLDSDMQVFQDIRQLWTWDFEGSDILSVDEPPDSGRLPQFSVMVLNCQQLRWHVVDLVNQLSQGKWTYEEFILKMAPANSVAAVLPTGWNDLERYKPESTALIHYTDMNTQPWLVTHNPLAYLWCRDFLKAVKAGFISLSEVKDEIKKGHVRPSLLYQIEHDLVDPQQLPDPVVQADRLNFVPPHIASKISFKPNKHPTPRAFIETVMKALYARVRMILNRYP